MPNTLKSVSFTGPPEYQSEFSALERRRRLAEALQAEGQTPISPNRMAGGYVVPISRMEGLAQLGKALSGGYMARKTDERERELSQQMSSERSQKLAEALRQGMGEPEIPQPAPELGGGPGRPAMPGNPMEMYRTLAGSKDPMLQQAGLQGAMANMPKPAEPFTLSPGERRFGPDNQPIAEGASVPSKLETVQEGDQKVTYELQPDGTRKEIARGPMFAKQVGPTIQMPQPVTPVTIQDPNDPSQTIVIDGRTRQVLGKGPKMTEAGLIDAKAMKSMSGLSADLQTAEDLLSGVTRTSDGQVVKGELPTASGIGSIYDAAAGFFGVSPSGAAEADSLKTVAARLIGRVPRFEGPQSDKDVILYRQAAGDAGNEKLPIPRRLAAIRTMRQIYDGYETGQRGKILGNVTTPYGGPDRRQPSSTSPAGVDPKVWAVMTPEERALWK